MGSPLSVRPFCEIIRHLVAEFKTTEPPLGGSVIVFGVGGSLRWGLLQRLAHLLGLLRWKTLLPYLDPVGGSRPC